MMKKIPLNKLFNQTSDTESTNSSVVVKEEPYTSKDMDTYKTPERSQGGNPCWDNEFTLKKLVGPQGIIGITVVKKKAENEDLTNSENSQNKVDFVNLLVIKNI